jgi:hypothetical protein
MNLTVGPLPPAVYWRRRAIVLGGILVVVIFMISMCSTTGGSGAPGKRNTSVTSTASPDSPSASSSPSSLPPIITGSPGAGIAVDPGTTDAPAGQPSASVDCSDNDIRLTAAVITQASGFNFSLKVKNVSDHPCNRDVGADPQELHVSQNGTVIWSSDYCQTVHGQPDVRTFGPGVEDVFTVHWDQKITGPGCVKGASASSGAYDLAAKLGTKISGTTSFQIGK